MDRTFVACLKCHAVNRVPLGKVDQKPLCGQCKSQLPIHGALVQQNPSALKALIQAADRPVVVDFWAPWCGPCLAFAPTFEKVAMQKITSFVFAKIDTEQFPEASQTYGVRGIPTLVVFDNGKEIQRISGALPMAQFSQWLGQVKLT